MRVGPPAHQKIRTDVMRLTNKPSGRQIGEVGETCRAGRYSFLGQTGHRCFRNAITVPRSYFGIHAKVDRVEKTSGGNALPNEPHWSGHRFKRHQCRGLHNYEKNQPAQPNFLLGRGFRCGRGLVVGCARQEWERCLESEERPSWDAHWQSSNPVLRQGAPIPSASMLA